MAVLCPASPVFAHASDRGHVLLLPTGYYVVGGALAVLASFLVLAVFRPRLLEKVSRPKLSLGHVREAYRLPASLLSFVFLAMLVAAGFFGSRDPLSNPLPLTVWTLFWVGLTLVQGLVGNVWAWINPWYGPWRGTLWLTGRSVSDPPRFCLPAGLGHWPAVILLFAFAWLELVYWAPDDPAKLAWVVGGYWCLSFAAVMLFGYKAWIGQGEFFSVFFGMLARFGVVERAPTRAGESELRLGIPGAKLPATLPLPPSGTVFLLLALASVSFDGLMRTFFWLGLNGVNPLEFPGRTALVGINSAGLLLMFAVLGGAYTLCVLAGERLAGSRHRLGVAAGFMVWSIVPIALAYHFSHYLTAFLVNGQYALVALSDPFSLDWNLFGTANLSVDAGIAAGAGSAYVIWNLQAAAIVGGHVVAVLAAHRLAYRLHETRRAAALSQMPLAALMVAYTVFGLWLLSTPTAG